MTIHRIPINTFHEIPSLVKYFWNSNKIGIKNTYISPFDYRCSKQLHQLSSLASFEVDLEDDTISVLAKMNMKGTLFGRNIILEENCFYLSENKEFTSFDYNLKFNNNEIFHKFDIPKHETIPSSFIHLFPSYQYYRLKVIRDIIINNTELIH